MVYLCVFKSEVVVATLGCPYFYVSDIQVAYHAFGNDRTIFRGRLTTLKFKCCSIFFFNIKGFLTRIVSREEIVLSFSAIEKSFSKQFCKILLSIKTALQLQNRVHH